MIASPAFPAMFKNGGWKQNAGLLQLLGLFPSLAISTRLVNALAIGLATTLVMAASSGVISSVRKLIPDDIRLAVFVLVVATVVTLVDLLMNAFVHPLSLALGFFIPLITTNCLVLARADDVAAEQRPLPAMRDAITMGLGLTSILTLLGGLREMVGNGTLFSGVELIFGNVAHGWVLHVLPGYDGFLLAILPPGTFIVLALLIAVRNGFDARVELRAVPVLNETTA
jgi:electron transport complex protein RnfE